jgi:hypothetical protein
MAKPPRKAGRERRAMLKPLGRPNPYDVRQML